MDEEGKNDPFEMTEFGKTVLELDEDLIKAVKYVTDDIGQHPVLGGPLLYILSVTVRLKIPPPAKGTWHIAGRIHVCPPPAEPEGGVRQEVDNIIMFERDIHSAQFLNPAAPYLTLHPASPLFFFFPHVDMYLSLHAKRPKSTELEPILDTVLPLDYTNYPDEMFDQVQHKNFATSNADVCVRYVTYRAACTAEVILSFDTPAGGQQPRELKVSGTIRACWHHDKGDFVPHTGHEEGYCHCVCLLDSSSSRVSVTAGHPLHLDRLYVAVPSYATLILEVALTINGVNCYHILDFAVQDLDSTLKEFAAGGFVGRCKIEWENEFSYKNEEPEEPITQTRPLKKTQFIHPQIPKPICFYDTQLCRELTGKRMIEIFCIYIGAYDKNTVYCLNGTVEAEDQLHKQLIFERNDGTCTRRFAHGMKLPLTGPRRCLQGMCFVLVDLKDEDGQEFCLGYMGWNDQIFRSPWLDKWMCSVIKGRLGYAAVYYVLHSSAVSCAVNVFLAAPSGCKKLYVSGFIAGEYDIAYLTAFDKKYNRSFLFDRGVDDSVVLSFKASRQPVDIPDSELKGVKPKEYWIPMPLSKSVVCVPPENTLVIEVDLTVEKGNVRMAPIQKLMGSMECRVGRKTWHMITSEDYQMFISVDWS